MLRRPRTDSLLTVLLWLLFFIAMTMKQAYGHLILSQEIHQVVRNFLEEVNKMESFDCRLYTPTLADYQQKCPMSTLKCFAAEVNILVFESGNKTSPLYKRNLTKRLTDLIKQEEGTNCPQCEVHREQAPNYFLTTLLNILEWSSTRH